MQTHSPIKRLFNKLENSIQTYINYHKTHAMATCFSGVGDTSMENLETQDIDNVSEDKFQDENIVQKLLCETACLNQIIEDRDNDPREAIHDLEQRLNRLTLTLCHSDTPIENMLDTPKLCAQHKRKHLCRVFYYKVYPY